MAKPNKLQPGDRVAYAAKFLKDTGQFTGSGPQRRGTFMSYYAGSSAHCRVKWDDFDFASSAAQWGEDYAEDAAANGQLVAITAVAKVGSPRFALNDM